MSSLNLFGNLNLTKIDQTPVVDSIPLIDEQEDFLVDPVSTTTISTEGMIPTTNNNGTFKQNSIKTLSYTRNINEDTTSNWVIYGAAFTLTEEQVIELLNLFNQADREDTITFYLPYNIDMYSAIAILNAAHRCGADITVVGAQQLCMCSSLLLLCGKIRASEYDMLIFKSLFTFVGGFVKDIKVSSEQASLECLLTYQLLELSGLLTGEECNEMQKRQSQVSLYGDKLLERVSMYNNTKFKLVKEEFEKYLR